jgi:hypothetical protein
MDEKKRKKRNGKDREPGSFCVMPGPRMLRWFRGLERGEASVLNLPFFFVDNPFLRMECMQFQSECYNILVGFDFVDGVVGSSRSR